MICYIRELYDPSLIVYASRTPADPELTITSCKSRFPGFLCWTHCLDARSPGLSWGQKWTSTWLLGGLKWIPGGSLGPLGGFLAALDGFLGLLLESWRAPAAVLEVSWSVSEPSWRRFGNSWGHLGGKLGAKRSPNGGPRGLETEL